MTQHPFSMQPLTATRAPQTRIVSLENSSKEILIELEIIDCFLPKLPTHVLADSSRQPQLNLGATAMTVLPSRMTSAAISWLRISRLNLHRHQSVKQSKSRGSLIRGASPCKVMDDQVDEEFEKRTRYS